MTSLVHSLRACEDTLDRKPAFASAFQLSFAFDEE